MPARVRPADLGFGLPLILVPRAGRGALTVWRAERTMLCSAVRLRWLMGPAVGLAGRLGMCPARPLGRAVELVRCAVAGLAAQCPMRRLGWPVVPV